MIHKAELRTDIINDAMNSFTMNSMNPLNIMFIKQTNIIKKTKKMHEDIERAILRKSWKWCLYYLSPRPFLYRFTTFLSHIRPNRYLGITVIYYISYCFYIKLASLFWSESARISGRIDYEIIDFKILHVLSIKMESYQIDSR